MEVKKILWVSNTLGIGGSERQLVNMYHILKEYSQYDIKVLYYAKAEHELSMQGIETIFIDKSKVGRIATVLKIRKYIRENDIQIVHALGGSSANIYGRAGAIYTKAIPVGAMKGKKHFARLGNKIANSILNLFGNWWMVNNKELIDILKKDLKFIADDKIRILHNGFTPAKQIDYHLHEITDYDTMKGDRFVFCAIGRLQPVKNYTLLIDATERILEQNPNIQLWIIGDGEEYNKLDNLIKQKKLQESIILWGYRNDTDVALSRCDVFVQTSISEGSPNTVIEAMRARKPIISTKSTDLSEMIEPGRNGEIVNSNREELAQAMIKMQCTNPEEMKQMGQWSYELFMRHFQDENVAKEYKDFYNEILSKR